MTAAPRERSGSSIDLRSDTVTRPSPAMPASFECTAVKLEGSTVTSWPIIGTTVVSVDVFMTP